MTTPYKALRSNSNKKKQNQRNHFLKRFKQRFGIDLTDEQVGQIRNQVRDGRVLECVRTSNAFAKYRIVWQELDMWVVYDRLRKQLVTAYPYGETQ